MLLRQFFAGSALRALILLAIGAADAAAAQEVVVTGFRPTPPYIVQKADGGLTGLEYELVTAAAQLGGLTLKPELAPFGRLPEDFRREAFGAIVPANAAMNLPGCLSDTVLVYRNMAFSLAQRGITLNEIADLANHDVLAFQNAQILLGPDMTAVRQGNQNYREVANQMLQVRALFSARTDVVILERRIFRYLMNSSGVGVDTSAPVAEHDLFAPVPYGVAFRRPEHCAAFNRGLAQLKRNGTYDAIMAVWDGPQQARDGRARSQRPPG